MAEWILANGSALDAEETTGPHGNCSITTTPPSVPFKVTLHRDCDYESRLFIMQGLVEAYRTYDVSESLKHWLVSVPSCGPHAMMVVFQC